MSFSRFDTVTQAVWVISNDVAKKSPNAQLALFFPFERNTLVGGKRKLQKGVDLKYRVCIYFVPFL